MNAVDKVVGYQGGCEDLAQIVDRNKAFYEKDMKGFRELLINEERAPNTIASYMQSISQYFKLYDEITKENMVEFKRSQLNSVKPATAKLRCSALNKYCDFIGKPECKVKKVRIQKDCRTENVPTMEEYQYLLSKLLEDNNMKMYWMIRFMASTGVRVSELLSLNKKSLQTGVMEMHSKGKIRRILIPKQIVCESKPYFQTVDNDLLFPNRYNVKMSTRGMDFEMSKLADRYGIRREVLHPHAFRHFFAIQFLKNGGELTLLSDLLGHESVKTTAIYLQLSESEQRQRLEDCLKW